jgi:hypothetical protein
MGHKGPVLRPRCIRPRRARTQILLYSSSGEYGELLIMPENNRWDLTQCLKG